MASPEPTILTKWGRLTGQQWLAARHREAMDAWWTAEVTAYVVANWPSPQQIEANRRQRSQQKRASQRRDATTKVIADCARVDRARRGSGSRLRPATPATQLNIL